MRYWHKCNAKKNAHTPKLDHFVIWTPLSRYMLLLRVARIILTRHWVLSDIYIGCLGLLVNTCKTTQQTMCQDFKLLIRNIRFTQAAIYTQSVYDLGFIAVLAALSTGIMVWTHSTS